MKIVLLFVYILFVNVVYAETIDTDCRSYYEVRGVRTCLPSDSILPPVQESDLDSQDMPVFPNLPPKSMSSEKPVGSFSDMNDPNAQDLDLENIPADTDPPTKGTSPE